MRETIRVEPFASWTQGRGVNIGPVVRTGGLVFVSGLQPFEPQTGEIKPMPIDQQSQTYRDQVYVTPSGMLHTSHLAFYRGTLGPECIMFSIDYSCLTMIGARRWLEGVPIPERTMATIPA